MLNGKERIEQVVLAGLLSQCLLMGQSRDPADRQDARLGTPPLDLFGGSWEGSRSILPGTAGAQEWLFSS